MDFYPKASEPHFHLSGEVAAILGWDCTHCIPGKTSQQEEVQPGPIHQPRWNNFSGISPPLPGRRGIQLPIEQGSTLLPLPPAHYHEEDW